MLGWFIWIKMIFDFIKRLFGLVDEGARKRRAEHLDNDCVESYASPKKHCCGLKGVHGGRVIYADENIDVEVELLGVSDYAVSRSKDKLNGGSCVRRKQAGSFHQSVSHQYVRRKTSLSKMNGKDPSRCSQFSLKSMDAMSSTDCKYSTLAKTNQLREKQEYSQLLQSFLPQRIHVIRDKAEEEPKKQTVPQVIDLEKYETPSKATSPGRSSCQRKSRESFHTPKTSTPLKWYTPRESTTLESAKAKNPKDGEITVLGAIKTPNEKVRDASTPLPRKSTLDAAKPNLTSARVVPVVTIKESDNEHPSKKSSPEEQASTSKPSTSSQVEIVPTNTLRDNLAAKAVMKQDFVPRVSGHYNERIEQRQKEVEELKRITCLLSKHNRLSREAALETQLAQSMRLCEAVLDETAALEDEALPTLTPQMHQEIKNALVPNPPNEVLVEGFGLRITRKDIHTLFGLNWLNDEVINFYMNLLIARGTSGNNYPKVHAMNTFFYPKLLSGGHSSLKRWTRKIDVFAQDLLVVPIHLGIHWCMSVIDFRNKTIRYFDSMGGANPKCLAALRQYLEDESMDKKKKPFDTKDWKLESMKNIPQQMNGSDCGVFSCMFAEFICADRKITFTQEDMPYFRKKMVYEILKAKLL